MRHLRQRRPTALAAIAALAFGLSACAGPAAEPEPEIPADPVAESYHRYIDFAQDLTSAISAEIPGVGWRAERPIASLYLDDTGTCDLQMQGWRSGTGVLRSADDFEQVLGAMKTTLADYGFPAMSDFDKADDDVWDARSMDKQGGHVTVIGSDNVLLLLSVPVASKDCSSSELDGLDDLW